MLWEETGVRKSFGLRCRTGDCSRELMRGLPFETSNLLSFKKGFKVNPP